MDLQDFCRRLPKLELHAHLNGSLSQETLKKLCKLQHPGEADYKPPINSETYSCLSEVFKAFDLTYSLTNTPEAIYIATKDVIREFCEDNVIYLELRTTPRSVEKLMTKREYIDAVIRAIKDSEAENLNIIVKLLISINRKQGKNAAKENVDLAIALKEEYPEYIVGIDLSGDPTQGDAFIKLMNCSRQVGLKISAHCGEVANETEVMDILNFKPDRLGHCTCVHPSLNGSDKQFMKLLELRTPVELCLTSNVKCKTVPTYAKHQFGYLYEANHPLCIATDDKGVFDTTLSKEYELLGKHFNLKKEELKEISKASVNYTFASNEEKNNLLTVFHRFDQLHKEQYVLKTDKRVHSIVDRE